VNPFYWPITLRNIHKKLNNRRPKKGGKLYNSIILG
jgi:hypothetical protein